MQRRAPHCPTCTLERAAEGMAWQHQQRSVRLPKAETEFSVKMGLVLNILFLSGWVDDGNAIRRFEAKWWAFIRRKKDTRSRAGQSYFILRESDLKIHS